MRIYIVSAFFSLSAVSFSTAQVNDFATADFQKADSIARLYPNHSLDNLKSLSDKLTSTLSTDVEKLRSIYTWTCLNIENDYTLAERNQQKRKKLKDPQALMAWNEEFSATVFKELRKNKRTVCTGYAYLIRELATFAGITCVIVDGYGRTVLANVGGTGVVNHSWNAVQLNNTWYLCDATWSSGAIDSEKKEFVKNYNDCYFLLKPELFVRNHYPLDTTYLLLNQKPGLPEFLNRPLIYSYMFDYKFEQLLPETFEVTAVKRTPVHFQFTESDKIVEKVQLEIKSGSSVSSVTPKFTQAGGALSFDHVFNPKGRHIVNVMLDGKYVVTYTVTVK